MRLLLDTCTFLWAALDDPKLAKNKLESSSIKLERIAPRLKMPV